jgi:hypothetical protein
MHTKRSYSLARWALVFGALLLPTACATTATEPAAGTPRLEKLSRPAAGSSWVIDHKASGSYGSGSGTSTIRSEGDQDFQGRKYWTYSVDGSDLSHYDAEGRTVGRTVNGAVRETSDPGFQSFAWPLHVGRSWVHSFRFTDHAAGRSFDVVRFWSKVEAYEDVATPAGTFKAFRIVHDNQSVQLTNWWSPDLALVVKSKAERKSTYYAGAGTRETELKSLDLKK